MVFRRRPEIRTLNASRTTMAGRTEQGMLRLRYLQADKQAAIMILIG